MADAAQITKYTHNIMIMVHAVADHLFSQPHDDHSSPLLSSCLGNDPNFEHALIIAITGPIGLHDY